jgi:tRNA threonylcarbamoyladenosine biosynthesis protein TsaB
MTSVHANPPETGALLLALDTASPTVSVAVGRGGECLAERSVELRRSSENLLRLVDEALAESGISIRELDGVVALRGPGSFTGLRVGLATALGLHQALELPATAVPTLEVLAVTAWRLRPDLPDLPDRPGPVAAVVDALRGEWFTQVFQSTEPGARLEADGPPEILSPSGFAERLAGASPARDGALVIGFGAHRLREDPDWPEQVAVVEPEILAPAALFRAAEHPTEWDPQHLAAPLYLRAPAVTLPEGRRAAPAPPRRDGR